MAKGLLKLNDDELNFINHKISMIDLQKGCPVQCIVCGNNAEKYSFNMPWKNFMELSDSILEIKAKKKIYLLGNKNKIKKRPYIYLFNSSDPVYYRSLDGNKERTLWDAVKILVEDHKFSTHITTAGWRCGNNYMQRTMENIVNAKKHGNPYIKIMYTIKTVSEKTIKEYLDLKQSDENNNSLERFIYFSNYSRNLIDNMKTLKGIKVSYSNQFIDYSWEDKLSNNDLTYVLQYMYYAVLDSLRIDSNIKLIDKYQSIKELFTLDTIDKISNHCSKMAGFDDIQKEFNKPLFHYRSFSGFGKAAQIGLPSVDIVDITKLTSSPDKDKKNSIKTEEFSVNINSEGILLINHGDNENLYKTIIPKKYFEVRSEYYKNRDHEKSKHFSMLANLQGKRLFD
ncbi:MAG: hypothetical protein ACP5N1_03915 [Candidatus Woesearchaeota archaeon]